jgi:hypothetical protein
LITGILSPALKDNDMNLEKGILTGIFDTIKKEFGSGLNNIKLYRIIDSKFSSSYGFSKE